MILKTKKGDIFQILFVLILLLLIGIMGLLFGTLSYKITDYYKTSNLLNNTQSGMDANQLMQDSSIPMMDFFVFFFFLGSNIALVLSAIRTNFTPTLVFIFLILLLIEILVASGFVDIYKGFYNDSNLAPVPSMMHLSNIIFSKYMPLIFGVIGVVILIVMYGKSGSDITP